MLVNVNGAKCVGIDAVPVTVEVEVTGGIGLHLVGLADTAVRESLLRTVTALQAKGFRIPGKKIIANWSVYLLTYLAGKLKGYSQIIFHFTN